MKAVAWLPQSKGGGTAEDAENAEDKTTKTQRHKGERRRQETGDRTQVSLPLSTSFGRAKGTEGETAESAEGAFWGFGVRGQGSGIGGQGSGFDFFGKGIHEDGEEEDAAEDDVLPESREAEEVDSDR